MDIVTGKTLRNLGFRNKYSNFSFSPDGRRLLVLAEKPRFVNFLFADLAEMTLGIIRPATERLRVTVA